MGMALKEKTMPFNLGECITKILPLVYSHILCRYIRWLSNQRMYKRYVGIKRMANKIISGPKLRIDNCGGSLNCRALFDEAPIEHSLKIAIYFKSSNR